MTCYTVIKLRAYKPGYTYIRMTEAFNTRVLRFHARERELEHKYVTLYAQCVSLGKSAKHKVPGSLAGRVQVHDHQ